MYRLKAKVKILSYAYFYNETTLAIVELPHLPRLLLLKFHVQESCAGLVLLLSVFVIVCRMTQFVAAVYCT